MSSSPFELFRRNLKPLMVLLTLLAIFSFVVLPALDTYLRRAADFGGESTTLASYDGGRFDQAKVNYFTRIHYNTVLFLRQLAETTMARGGTPGVSGFRYDTQRNEIQSLGINDQPSDRASVLTMMYAAEARKAGLDLDDNAVRDWLTAFTDGRLSEAEINGVLHRATRNQVGQFHLYEHLRVQLLSQMYQRKAMAALAVEDRAIVPPAQQWDLFLRLNRRAVADAYAVPVADYIERTSAQPSADEIRRVYEDGKDRFPDDQSPLPAFRRPYVANIQYVAGALDDFIEREIQNFSEEQLRAEYERRLAGGDFQMPAPPDEPTPPADPADADMPADPAAPADPGDPAVPTDPAAPAAPVDPAAPAAPGPETTAPAEPADPAPAAEPAPALDAPQTDAPVDEPTAPPAPGDDQLDEPAAPAQDQQSAVPRSNRSFGTSADGPAIRLTAFRPQDDTQPAGDEQPAADDQTASNAAPAPAEGDQPPPANDATDVPASDPPAQPESPPAPVDAAPADAPADAAPAATEPAATESPADEPPADEPVRTQSFEDVRDEIARDLAMRPALTKRDAAITEVERAMRNHFTAVAIAGPTGQQPERPDLAALAQRLGMTYTETGLIDARQVQEEPIARSFGLGTGMQRGTPYLQTMFIDRPPLLTPVRTVDDQAGVSYVSWKTEQRDAMVPALDEIRDEVVLAIRTAEARQLARAEADRLAKEFNATQRPVGELIPEDRSSLLFQSVGPFSWMNSFGFGMQAFMGNVPELDNVGEAFMRQVFTSERDQWGVAPNNPESVFYVVRPTEFSPSTEELYQRFTQLFMRLQASTLAVEEVMRIRDGHYEALDNRTGFQWNEEALQ